MKQIFVIAVLALAAYLWLGGTSSAATTTQASANDGACVAAYADAYSAEWARMSTLQRAVIGLAAAGCAP